MPKIPEYPPVTADQMDSDDQFVMNVDTTTRSVKIDEVKKSVNRVEFVTQTSNYTPVLSDEGKVIRMNSASPVTFTVPPNSAVPYAIGVQFAVRSVGAGQTTIVPGSGVIIGGSSFTVDQYGTVVLVKVGTNTWDLFGSAASGPDVTAPTVVSRTAINPTTIRVILSETVTATNVGHSFKKNGSNLAISSISGSGTNALDFTVATMAPGDTLLHSYNSTTGDTEDSAGNELASFTDQAVTNSVTDAPYVTGAVADEEGVAISFNESVTGSAAGWTIKKNGTPMTINSVTQPVSTVLLFGFVETIAEGDVLTWSYDPATGDTVDSSSNELGAATDQPITNTVVAPDSDALAYIAAEEAASGGTISTSNKEAIDTLIKALKAGANNWAQLKGLYLAFGTGLVNARVPGTFNLIPGAGTAAPTVNASGYVFDGVNDYFDTDINQLSDYTTEGQDNESFAVYVKAAASGTVLGVYDGAIGHTYFAPASGEMQMQGTSDFTLSSFGNGRYVSTVRNSAGSTTWRVAKDSVQVYTTAVATAADRRVNGNFWLGGFNNITSGAIGAPCACTLGLVAIGAGLTNTQMAELDAAMADFINATGRA